MMQMPSQEQFDAMPDVHFCDWWDRWFEAQQSQAVSEDEVQEAERVMREAFDRRWEA